jgi:hypothetical protein
VADFFSRKDAKNMKWHKEETLCEPFSLCAFVADFFSRKDAKNMKWHKEETLCEPFSLCAFVAKRNDLNVQ